MSDKEPNKETVILQCSCGRWLRGTVEREPPSPFEFPVGGCSEIKVTISQVMALCPGCGMVVTTPLELTSAPVLTK